MTEKTAIFAKIGGQGRLTLPSEVRKAAHLEEGQLVEITIVDDDTLMIKAQHVVDRHQAWVWSEAWLSKLSEAREDLAAGRVATYDSDDEFLASLGE